MQQCHMPLFLLVCLTYSSRLDCWSASLCRSLLARCRGGWLRVIALLRGTLEDVVGGIRGERLNTHQFPSLAAQAVHVTACKCAAPLVVVPQRLQSFAGDATVIVDIGNLIGPLRHNTAPSRDTVGAHFIAPS